MAEDEDGLGVHGVEGVDEPLDRGIHGLAALDDDVGPEFLEGVHEPGAGGHGHDAESLAALLEPLVHVVLVVLQGHVLHLDGEELAVLLAVVQDLARGVRMDMDLDDGAVAEEHQGFAVLREPVRDDGLVEGVQVHLAPLQPQQELRAVAELEDAVLGEGVQVYVLRRGDGLVQDFGGLPVQGGAHAFGNVQQACAAAVHHARLLQHVQQFGRVLQGQVHRGDQEVEVFIEVLAARGGLGSLPEHG